MIGPPSRLLTTACAAAFMFCSTSAAFAAPGDREVSGQFSDWLPPDVSTHGHEIDTLFNWVLGLTTVTCVGVFAAMIVFLIRYRHRPGRQATFIHGNNSLETVWTLIPTAIMALVAALSQSSWSRAKYMDQMPEGEGVVHVDVIGKQFKWYFHYPGKDGQFGPRKRELVNLQSPDPEVIIGLDRSAATAKDDLVSAIMVVPVNKKIRVRTNSVDVLHSFFLPNFRVKQDAVPGLLGNVWFEATKTSEHVIGSDPSNPLSIIDGETYARVTITDAKPFDIVCAELCGSGHYTMRGLMYVVTQSQYEKWLEVAQKNVLLAAEDEE